MYFLKVSLRPPWTKINNFYRDCDKRSFLNKRKLEKKLRYYLKCDEALHDHEKLNRLFSLVNASLQGWRLTNAYPKCILALESVTENNEKKYLSWHKLHGFNHLACHGNSRCSLFLYIYHHQWEHIESKKLRIYLMKFTSTLCFPNQVPTRLSSLSSPGYEYWNI